MNLQADMKKRNPVVNTFENYGSIFGFFLLGAIAGVLLAGPNFQVWTPLESVLTIFGGGLIAGVIGHLGLAMTLSATGAGNNNEYSEKSTDEAISLNEMGD
jgi:hypothetical protein